MLLNTYILNRFSKESCMEMLCWQYKMAAFFGPQFSQSDPVPKPRMCPGSIKLAEFMSLGLAVWMAYLLILVDIGNFVCSPCYKVKTQSLTNGFCEQIATNINHWKMEKKKANPSEFWIWRLYFKIIIVNRKTHLRLKRKS